MATIIIKQGATIDIGGTWKLAPGRWRAYSQIKTRTANPVLIGEFSVFFDQEYTMNELAVTDPDLEIGFFLHADADMSELWLSGTYHCDVVFVDSTGVEDIVDKSPTFDVQIIPIVTELTP